MNIKLIIFVIIISFFTGLFFGIFMGRQSEKTENQYKKFFIDRQINKIA